MPTTNVVLYARYSSSGQNDKSPEQQFEVCEEYCKRNGYTVITRYIDEAKTGTNDKRPDFQRMIGDSRSGNFQFVIVYKLDRFARNRYDSAHYKAILRKNGVKVLSACENIADDPSGIILESMLEGMAEHYSANLSQNVKRGMNYNASQCLCTGGNRTLGYKIVDKKFVIDPLTAPVIKNIFELYAKGNSAPEILKILNAQHIKSVYGKDISLNNIYGILRNKRYAGYYTYKGTETKGGIPAIISEELFNQVQELMAKNKKAPARAKAVKEKYLLSSKMICGYCGCHVTGISGTSHSGGKKYFYYSCGSHSNKNKHKKCELNNFRKQVLEDFVVEQTLTLLTPERIDIISKKVVELCEKERANKSGIKVLETRLKQTKKEIKNLLAAIKSGKAQQILLEELERLQAEQSDIELEILKEEIKFPVLTIDKVNFFISQFTKGNVKDLFFREKLIDTFVNDITVYNDKITISYHVGDGYSSGICIYSTLAGAEGFEPSTCGFGDRYSTS